MRKEGAEKGGICFYISWSRNAALMKCHENPVLKKTSEPCNSTSEGIESANALGQECACRIRGKERRPLWLQQNTGGGEELEERSGS